MFPRVTAGVAGSDSWGHGPAQLLTKRGPGISDGLHSCPVCAGVDTDLVPHHEEEEKLMASVVSIASESIVHGVAKALLSPFEFTGQTFSSD